MWVLLILAALLALAAGLLAVPLHLRIVSPYGDPRWRVRIEWLFGLVRQELGGGEKKPREAQTSPLERLRRLQRMWASELRPRVVELIRELVRLTHIKQLRAHLRLGLGDPAATGMAFAALVPVVKAIGERPNVDVRVEPDFIEPGMRGDIDGAIRIVPLRWLRPVFGFACSPETIRAVWAARR